MSMDEKGIERLLSEAREGERLIREFKPDFELESLVTYSLSAFKQYGYNMGFGNPEKVLSDRVNVIKYGMEEIAYDAAKYDSALEALKALNSEIAATKGKGARELSYLERNIADFRLYYGRIINFSTEVDAKAVYQRMLDMRDSAKEHSNYDNLIVRKKAAHALEFLNDAIEESRKAIDEKYLSGNSSFYLSSKAIASDLFKGEMPPLQITFTREAKEPERPLEMPAPKDYSAYLPRPSPSRPSSPRTATHEEQQAEQQSYSAGPSDWTDEELQPAEPEPKSRAQEQHETTERDPYEEVHRILRNQSSITELEEQFLRIKPSRHQRDSYEEVHRTLRPSLENKIPALRVFRSLISDVKDFFN